jgi:hypothetical protein
MTNIKENDIIILIGAGCSKEAGIPTSLDMIKEIEHLIIKDDNWKKYKELYYFLKSSILYADGLKGNYEENLNIERLVNTLNELEKKEEHPIFPFIGSWNSKVVELCGNNFDIVREFKKKILDKLKTWVTLNDYTKANYYRDFFEFQKKLNFALRIFSLNYDLCLEKNNLNSDIVELGFDEQRKWQWQRFEKNENLPVNIYLYKMHGSINWKRDENGFLTFSDEVNQILEPDLIFGTNYKLQYIDPYLFYAYEFRKYSLESMLIITIGYSFSDDHINGIIGQAIRSQTTKKLLVNLYEENNKDEEKIKNVIAKKINSKPEQIFLKNQKASEFLKGLLYEEALVNFFNQDTEFD